MPTRRIPPRWAVAFGLALAPALAATATAQAPKSATSLQASDTIRHVPAEGLVALVEYDGTEAHAPAWRRTALAKLLNDTKLGAMAEDLLTQAIAQGLARAQGEDKPTPAEIIKLAKELFADGGTLAVYKPGPGDKGEAAIVLVVRDGERNGFRAMFERLGKQPGVTMMAEERGKRTLNRARPESPAWWVEGRDVVLASAPIIDRVIATIDGQSPSAAGHPIRAELARGEPGVATALTAFVDFSALPPMPPDAIRLGFDGIKRVDFRWGFSDEALYSALSVVAPLPRRGVLALADSPAFPRFDKSNLPAVPAGVGTWATLSLDPAPLWSWVVDQARQQPGPPQGGPPKIVAFEQAIPQILGGLRLKEDVLGPLGPRWTVYADVAALSRGNKGKAAVTVELRDSAAAANAMGRIITVAAQILEAQAVPGRPKPAEIVQLPGATPAYRIVLSPQALPPTMKGISPTIVVGKKRLAIAVDEAEARGATAVGDRWRPGPDFAPAIGKLPGDLVALVVSDPRSTLPQQITGIPLMLGMLNAATMTSAKPGETPFTLKADPARVPTVEDIRSRLSPGTVAVSIDAKGLKIVSRESAPSLSSPATSGVAVALLLPAVQASREAARRAQSTNNFKQIGLALHNYESTNGHFPAAAITSKDGKPLLSWRVAILPYLDQADLYNQFHLDEPWDSEHNKTLIPRMPTVFLNPSTPNPVPGETHYLAFTGPHAAFSDKPNPIASFLDGTSNTLMVADSTKGVPWSKPEEMQFDINAQPSLFGAGSPHPGGFSALFADGSVRFLLNKINPVTFKALISRDGGEIISRDDF
ncbi:DUF1559 domain-containing protein [Tundrisphaera sp. TA3]|uniref:DUF1559 domain-containing protein n=1 Tax=Tundrisphaera sp. TA3 TaxID=3435775 RepID=UPI003EC038F5